MPSRSASVRSRSVLSTPLAFAAVVALVAAATLLAPTLAAAAPAQSSEPPSPFDHLAYRNVGPVNMSGRVADVEGVAGDPNVVWVGAASGGVWKSVDGGLTFDPVFDDQPIASIGAIGIAPSNPDVVYVGTGESAVRNSVSFGNGVYKTTDGGQSWSHVGLDGTRHISKVLVDPTDPDTVYVGALGSIYGPSEQRGVFKSTDGGATWQKVLYLDDTHGVADLGLDPSNPKILYAALWYFDRKPWTFISGDEKGGLWKSVDGGATWEKLDGKGPKGDQKGLPKLIGRIGVQVARSHPETVYAIAESNEGTLFRSDDRGVTFRKVCDEPEIVSRGLYYTHVRVDPMDENRVYAVASRLQVSIDGGHTFKRISRTTHVDFHALWIDPTDPDRMWQGQDGGVAVSYDRGATWEPIRNLPIAQFYQVNADDRQPFYRVGGGLQDNGTWVGPSRTREPAGILEDDWRMISFGDAYWLQFDPDDPDLTLSESQGGAIVRTHLETRQQEDVSPQPRRNDGGPVGDLEYRFNWDAPIVASPFDGSNGRRSIYFGGNVVFKSPDFGETWEVISPDLTTDDPAKQGPAGGPIWPENTTAEYHTTIISLAESPVQQGVLWAGTDDGNLQVTRDGGATWTNVVGNVSGLARFSPVSHVEPSATAAGTAYAAFDRHMFDDLAPHLYKTTDFGATWKRLSTDGIPERAWVHIVREDPTNPDLLYAGTELGLFASWDQGRHWSELDAANLPTVPVHDLVIQPREDDLIVGTHGRAMYIFDDLTPIQQWSPQVAAEPAHLFPVRPALRFPVRFTRYGLGDQEYKSPNPPYGALISYSLAEKIETPPKGDQGTMEDGEAEEGMASRGADGEDGDTGDAAAESEAMDAPIKSAGDRIRLEILDADGTVVRTIEQKKLPTEKGINRVAWDLTYDGPAQRKVSEGLSAEEEFFGPERGPAALPGTYTVRLTVDGTAYETPVEVRLDPLVDTAPGALDAAFRMASDLTAVKSAVNTALRGLDVVVEESAARRAHVKQLGREVPEALDAAWKAREKEAQELIVLLGGEEGKPYWSQAPPLLSEVGSLERNVDGGFRAPSAPQEEYYRDLEDRVGQALDAVNAYFGNALPALNEQLEQANIPPLFTPDPITVP